MYKKKAIALLQKMMDRKEDDLRMATAARNYDSAERICADINEINSVISGLSIKD